MTGTLTFLGTGTSQGVPMLGCECLVCKSSDSKDKRLRTSALLEIGKHTICIDSGPDFRYQLLRADCKNLDAIIFTHSHRDHIAGIDDVRAYNHKQHKPMPIYGAEEVIDALARDYAYIFNSNYPGIPKLDVKMIDENPFYFEDLKITPIPVFHFTMPVFGYRIGQLAYITDAKTVPESSRKLLKDLDVLVVNCLHEYPHISHFNLEEALKFVEDIQPKTTYLTHMSHLIGLHEELIHNLPPNIIPAHDTLKIEFKIK